MMGWLSELAFQPPSLPFIHFSISIMLVCFVGGCKKALWLPSAAGGQLAGLTNNRCLLSSADKQNHENRKWFLSLSSSSPGYANSAECKILGAHHRSRLFL
jgi:hypothetical protein